MDKKYHSLGLMSGTSLDGIDASIIESDGESIINIRKNAYQKARLEVRINKTGVSLIPSAGFDIAQLENLV